MLATGRRPRMPDWAAPGEEGARRYVRACILRAFSRNPRLGWTVGALTAWYGLRIDRVRTVLRELLAAGAIEPVGPGTYRWKPPALPATAAHRVPDPTDVAVRIDATPAR